jgi:hypothetical protein
VSGSGCFFEQPLTIQQTEQGCHDMKSTILLATTLFLASAPSPDAKTITELSAGFLTVSNDYALMASETDLSTQHPSSLSSRLESRPTSESYLSVDQKTDYTNQSKTTSGQGKTTPGFGAQIN